MARACIQISPAVLASASGFLNLQRSQYSRACADKLATGLSSSGFSPKAAKSVASASFSSRDPFFSRIGKWRAWPEMAS